MIKIVLNDDEIFYYENEDYEFVVWYDANMCYIRRRDSSAIMKYFPTTSIKYVSFD